MIQSGRGGKSGEGSWNEAAREMDAVGRNGGEEDHMGGWGGGVSGGQAEKGSFSATSLMFFQAPKMGYNIQNRKVTSTSGEVTVTSPVRDSIFFFTN